MAAPLPSPIDKRNMLWAPDPRRPFDAPALGDGFFETGRFAEALDFYERIPEASGALRAEKFGKVKSHAIETGSAFLLARIAGKNLAPVSQADWKQCAKAANAAGQLRYALRASIQAGDDAMTAELRAKLGDAVPQALAAQAESPEQAKVGVLTPGHKVEAVLATGAAHSHEPLPAPAPTPPAPPANGNGSGNGGA